MSRDHVSHADLVRFADERVNLKRDDAADLRAQANRLRDRLETYLADHPDFALRKMMLSGSLAKGTALKSISDIDVGCYVSSDTAPEKISDLIDWLAKKLEKAFPNFKPEQIKRKTYSVGVTFIATGNEVDIVPILYAGDPQWRGDLVSQDTGEKLMTSVPMHLEFIRKRKSANDKHFAQVVRFMKFWSQLRKQQDENFRFKSFMIELVVAYLADHGLALNDYPSALSKVFASIANDDFETAIAFADYYNPATCVATGAPVRIWDPVNHKNNVSALYTQQNKEKIVEAALDAGDAIDSALRAITKGETVRYWQKIFGPTFNM
ncbi:MULTISPECIES: CBASS oligonucleotide cyclase [Mesorhizobium]|uniref:CBASS oligonucleotide cyclase n=1 Tax=Mesorhizobium TaxID=68287 RepID=UPI0007FC9097|nr:MULTISPECIES: CBASS oligonucleotide cyclase [Mesorhizobium]MUT27059.1 nucleotidyltransferase [Mesorhizobium japonicum]OBQ74034.1 nucleotidyltransferase [Mesorhizobium sp. WSM3873]